MKFELLFLKLLQFLDIQGSILDSNIYMPQWLFTPICWVFLLLKWWLRLAMWTLCSNNIYISVIVRITEDYLCYYSYL